MYKKPIIARTNAAEATAVMAAMTSLWEAGLGEGVRGRMREEILAGNEAKVADEGGGGGGGGAGNEGKNGELEGGEGESENGCFGLGLDGDGRDVDGDGGSVGGSESNG